MVDEVKKVSKVVPRGENKAYPLIKLDRAIDAAKVVSKCRFGATKSDLEIGLKVKGGALSSIIAYTKRWGIITGRGKLTLTDLGKQIIYPSNPEEALSAKKGAFLNVPMFKEVHEKYKNQEYPEDDLFKNMLIREYNIKDEKDAIRLINIIRDSKNKLFGGHEKIAIDEEEPTLEEQNSGSSGTDIEKQTTNKSSFVSALNADIYLLIKEIGYLEAMSKSKITPDSETEVITILEDVFNKSTQFRSLNLTANMTLQELKSKSISVETCLKRISFFDEALKADLNITKEINEGVQEKI
jgi:hypothetical protein